MRFHISTVLSVTTGKLLSKDGMDGIYAIMSHLAGRSLFTHELVIAFRIYASRMLLQFPQLKEVSTQGFNADTKNHFWRAWENQFGEALDVAPDTEVWNAQDAGVFGNLQHMTDKPIIVV